MRKSGNTSDWPGLYRMLDGEHGALCWQGKKSEGTRAFLCRPTGHNNRILRMIEVTRDMEFIRTETETDALLLEANLIKKLRPRYNILLRDDKSFPYILLADDHTVPQLIKHRGARRRPGSYWAICFGGSRQSLTQYITTRFLLRSCSTAFMKAARGPACCFK